MGLSNVESANVNVSSQSPLLFGELPHFVDT